MAGSVNEDALFGNLEACRRAGLRNGVPTAFYVQAVGGRGLGFAYKYTLEASADGESWFTLIDRRDSTDDLPHDYRASLKTPRTANRRNLFRHSLQKTFA